ncbi:MAG: hypothetical protein ABIT01_13210 [Thermoanaerobaculia bacterium]
MRAAGSFRLLIRHFSARLLELDDVDPDGDLDVSVSHVLACVAGPGVVLPFLCYVKFIGNALGGPPTSAVIEQMAWADRALFLSLAMATVGIATLVFSEGLFPDDKDFLNLMPLPLTPAQIFAAKLASLGSLLVQLFVASNGVSAVVFPMIVAQVSSRTIPVSRLIAAHLISLGAACLFVFLALSALQGLLLGVLRGALSRRISALVQVGGIVLLASLVVSSGPIAVSWQTHLDGGGGVSALPPIWFLGLYDVLLGTTSSFSRLAADRALLALGIAFLAFVASYFGSYRGFLLHAGAESGSENRRGTTRGGALAARFTDRGDPVRRATFQFFVRTFLRTPRHRLMLAVLFGSGLALALPAIRLATAPAGAGSPASGLLAAPLVCMFVILLGSRLASSVPSQLRASWVFRTILSDEVLSCRRGVKSAMVVVGVLPPAFVSAIVVLSIWGPGLALLHLAFDAAAGLLLVELLGWSVRGVPFTTSFRPGGGRITEQMAIVLAAFLLFGYGLAALEEALLRYPAGMASFLAATVAILLGSRRLETEFPGDAEVVFDELPDTPALGLEN